MPEPITSSTDAAASSSSGGDFGNASPFRRQREENDPVRNGILIGLAVVLFVFLYSMIAVVMMHAPPV